MHVSGKQAYREVTEMKDDKDLPSEALFLYLKVEECRSSGRLLHAWFLYCNSHGTLTPDPKNKELDKAHEKLRSKKENYQRYSPSSLEILGQATMKQ
ncbi:hypothetical protein ACLOJK_039077 [Asimina triloba]